MARDRLGTSWARSLALRIDEGTLAYVCFLFQSKWFYKKLSNYLKKTLDELYSEVYKVLEKHPFESLRYLKLKPFAEYTSFLLYCISAHFQAKHSWLRSTWSVAHFKFQQNRGKW